MISPNLDRYIVASGDLYRTPAGEPMRLLRADYAVHHRTISTGAELRASIRAGAYAWPGGYALAFVTSDGALLCFDCARAELRQLLHSIRTRANDGWRVEGITGEHEHDENDNDTFCACDHCGIPVWDAPSNDHQEGAL